MPAQAHQSSARLVEAAAATPLPQPAMLLVAALAVGDVASAALDWTGRAGMAYRIVDAHAVKTGATAAASANTDQLQTAGGVAITNALNMQVADTALVRAGTIDDVTDGIAAAAGLRDNHVEAGENSAAILYVKLALT